MAFDLAALSLQADVGDYYDQSNNNYFEPHNYVPPDVSFNSVCVCVVYKVYKVFYKI